MLQHVLSGNFAIQARHCQMSRLWSFLSPSQKCCPSVPNTVLAITCHNFDAGSPNSHHRHMCTTWRPRIHSMMSDLDLTYFPRSQTQKTAKWCSCNNLPQLWCRFTKFTPLVHRMEASVTFDDEWPWPDLLSKVTDPKDCTMVYSVIITCHNFDLGSPNLHHRFATWRPQSSLIMSDLDLFARAQKNAQLCTRNIPAVSFLLHFPSPFCVRRVT